MDVNEHEQRLSTNSERIQPLFPIPSSSQHSSIVQPLFPVLETTNVNDEIKKKDKQLDWLQNKSYDKKAEASVVELQRAIEKHEAQLKQKDASSPEHEERSNFGDNASLAKSVSAHAYSDDENSADDRSKRKKRSKHKKHKKHKSKRTTSPDVQSSGLPVVEEFKHGIKKTFLEEMPGLEAEHAFRIDRNRDKDLWTYESVYKHHIASYRRLGFSAVGLDRNTNLFKGVKTQKPDQLRYCERKNRALVKKAGQRIKAKDVVVLSEYIPVNDSDEGGNEISRTVDPLRLMDEATNLYLQGKGKTDEKSVPESSLDDEETLKVASYNRRLRENPKDVKLWTEFVRFQDQIFNTKDKGRLSQALIDKKLAILDRALTENPGCLDLMLVKLEVCENVWEHDRLAKEWDQLLFVHSDNVTLWQRYLVYQQSRIATFSVSKMIKLYHKCIKILAAVMEGQVATARPTGDLDISLVDIFHCYCMFLHQAGYTEKAVASYQAQIEFNMFCPETLASNPTSDRVAVFERFWDSNIPRFGESGAQGWAKWSRDKTPVPVAVPVEGTCEDLEEEVITKDIPLWKKWLELEKAREDAHWLPWRPDISKNETEEDCEDLERLVLVDDVIPALFKISLPNTQFRLFTNFFKLLGLDASVVTSSSLEQEVLTETFMQSMMDRLYQMPAASGIACGLDSMDRKLISPEVLKSFTSNILSQVSQLFEGHHQTVLTLLHIHWESLKDDHESLKDVPKDKAKQLRKFVKSLLKEKHNRNNLVVWNAYAWMENNLGKPKDAVGVVETALTMFSAGEDQTGVALLYQTYCQLLLTFTNTLSLDLLEKQPSLEQTVKTKVMSSLTCLAEGSKFQPKESPSLSSSLILRTRNKLQSHVAHLFEELTGVLSTQEKRGQEEFMIYLNCLAMFDLCASGLQTALSHYSTNISNIESSSSHSLHTIKGCMYKSSLLLIQNYMSVGHAPLSVFRSFMDRALASFPASPEFLKCFVDIESKSRVMGRLRRYVDKNFSMSKSPVFVMMGVLAEASRMWSSDKATHVETEDIKGQWHETGIMNRIRSLLERGIQTPTCQHCPLVWRIYCYLESTYGQRERAKGVFYRALQQCPWAKVLYMDGVKLFGVEVLQEMVDIMTEKELRVQIPVEELELLTQSEPAAPPEDQEEDEEEEEEGMKSDEAGDGKLDSVSVMPAVHLT